MTRPIWATAPVLLSIFGRKFKRWPELAGLLLLVPVFLLHTLQAAQETGQLPVPTSAQVGMGSQIPTLAQNPGLSQDEVRDQIPIRSAPLPHGEGARRMSQRLRAIFDGTDWRADPNKPFDRIPYYQALLTHKLSLQDEMAVRLEDAFGVSAEFWLDMQKAYDIWKVKRF